MFSAFRTRRNAIVKLRGEGMTEEKVAEKLGISPATLHRRIAQFKADYMTGRRSTSTNDGLME
jgi:transposase